MNCENCGKVHDGTFASGKFCNRSCACAFSTKLKRTQINEKRRTTLKTRFPDVTVECEFCHKMSVVTWKCRKQKFCNLTCSGKMHRVRKGPRKPTSILELSSRTVTKIIQRLKIGCSQCGWNKAICDIHHIRGKKIENPNAHGNLTYICPNCHRMVHSGKIAAEKLVTLDVYVGDRWLDYYNG